MGKSGGKKSQTKAKKDPVASDRSEPSKADARCDEKTAIPVATLDDPRVVLVKKDHHEHPHRISVTLKATEPGGGPVDFDGKAKLSCTKAANIKLFSSEKDGDAIDLPLEIDDTSEFGAGKKLWIEGVKASASKEDVELDLTLSATGAVKVGAHNPAKVKLTCLELTLDIGKARKPDDPTADPEILSKEKKLDPGRYVHVQDADPLPLGPGDTAPTPADALRHERAQVIVRKAKPEDWEGVLTLIPCDDKGKKHGTPTLEMFAEENPAKSQTAKPTPHEIEHKSGYTEAKLYIQGKTTSAKVKDCGIKVGVKDLADSSGEPAEGDRVALTVIETELACCKSRKTRATAADDYPEALSFEDKFKKGRYVHKQHDQHHGRGGLLVKKIKPDDFKAKLDLVVWDRTADKKDSPRLEIFTDEVPATGQAALANPYEIDYDGSTWPAKGKPFWIQGKTTSGKLRDSEIRLRVVEHVNRADCGAATVVEFNDLEVTVPVTPPNTTRGAPVNNAPTGNQATHVKKAALTSAVEFSEEMRTGQTGFNEPLVLMENGVPNANKVKLKVKVKPDKVPVKWSANRDRRKAPHGDHPNVIALAGNPADGPSLSAVGGKPLEQELLLDAAGSFHIRPFVDGNDSGKYEDTDATSGERIDREPYGLMNLVLVRADLTAPNHTSVARPGNVSINSAAGRVGVSTGSFANGAGAGVNCKGKVTVTGGGRDGKLGLDYAFAGWVNTEKPVAGSPAVPPCEDAVATYRDPGAPPATPPSNHVVFSFWTDPANGNFTRYGPSPPGPALPATRLSGPVLDTTNFGNEGVGGNRAVGCEGAVGPPVPIVKAGGSGGIGQFWTVEMWDSPGDSAPWTHPFRGAARLVAYRFNLDFRADLVFWTSQSKAPAPQQNATPADRLYVSVAQVDWQIRANYTVNPGTGALTPVTALTISRAKTFQGRARPVEGTGLEVRFPITLRCLALDCSG